MTATEIYKSACALLGARAVGISAEEDTEIKKDVPKMLESLLCDLGYTASIANMSAALPAPESTRSALVYGLSADICIAFGIPERLPHFENLYKSARAKAKCKSSKITDKLPRGEA